MPVFTIPHQASHISSHLIKVKGLLAHRYRTYIVGRAHPIALVNVPGFELELSSLATNTASHDLPMDTRELLARGKVVDNIYKWIIMWGLQCGDYNVGQDTFHD